MDIKAGKPYPSGDLSNFKPRTFTVRGIECASMEGFVQALKFKGIEMQKHICTLTGRKAKSSGAKKNWHTSQTLWWQGKPIKRDSDEYQQLLDEAFNALFDQNEGARKALLASGDAVLKHSVGKTKIQDTVLTEREFCSRLTKKRAELKAKQFLE
jgi:predicted NAD-dependent protein-ADP-ribosyltransferase YbiA (DUF1768 family)